MRIQLIDITNYKAFLGNYKIKVDGKNLFIYGENGSGKSSLYYALKDFFQSSIEMIDLNELENIFVSPAKKGKASIKVTFKPNSQGQRKLQSWTWNNTTNDTRNSTDTSIRDSNKLKSFLTYKHLLSIHHLKKDDSINLFDLLVKGVLKHFSFPLTGGKELGQLWDDINEILTRSTSRSYSITKKSSDIREAIKIFNIAFSELFKPSSPDYILDQANSILNEFHHNIELTLNFTHARPNSDHTEIEGAEVRVSLKYAGKTIDKPHLFLNEARLSAIAISIYLGMIKRHPQLIPCKILFLDDIFIGLDISNRLPLLGILETKFPEYQIFITTYDKPWFEHARGFLEQNGNWKAIEFYAQTCSDGTETPFIVDDLSMISKAKQHVKDCDYKAAAVYTRTAFEKIIQKHCEKKKKAVVFKSRLKNYTTEDFWKVVKKVVKPQTIADIETYRPLVLNAFSHYNTERHEVKRELESAIKAIETLETELK